MIREEDRRKHRNALRMHRFARRDFLRAAGICAAPFGVAVQSAVGQTQRTNEGRPANAGRRDQAKVTLVQFSILVKSPDSVIRRMRAFFEKASEYGSDLIVFPEYVLGFGVTMQSETVQQLLLMAREHSMYAVAGMVEQHANGKPPTGMAAFLADISSATRCRPIPPMGGRPFRRMIRKPAAYWEMSSPFLTLILDLSASCSATMDGFRRHGGACPMVARKSYCGLAPARDTWRFLTAFFRRACMAASWAA